VTQLLLSPHNDDEALFASYIALREKPKVIVALLGARKKNYPAPIDRVAESAAAMEILGCEFEQLHFACDPASWDIVETRLRDEPDPDRVWVPTPEPNGHSQHNKLARLANEIWPGRLSYYSTYRTDRNGWPTRTTHGHSIAVEEGWPELKRRALDCYQTQIQRDGTRMHFERSLDEYEMHALRLNLGGGINPIGGFVNLDKSAGWMFESGLTDYANASVEAISVSHVLMYIDPERWPFIFDEFARVLQPGGFIRITEDAIGAARSSRPVIRPGAAIATTPELVLEHLTDVGLAAARVEPDETGFVDGSLIQQNYGQPPDVFHVEGTKT
jgi:LmbE family N-acetylglucosaminyl deacetylase